MEMNRTRVHAIFFCFKPCIFFFPKEFLPHFGRCPCILSFNCLELANYYQVRTFFLVCTLSMGRKLKANKTKMKRESQKEEACTKAVVVDMRARSFRTQVSFL